MYVFNRLKTVPYQRFSKLTLKHYTITINEYQIIYHETLIANVFFKSEYSIAS